MTEPCQMCGSPVRIRHKRMPATLGESRGEMFEERVCTNRGCDSNNGRMTLADVV